MKKEQGITLIILTVTIVILLILSGVTVNLALKDDGTLNKIQDLPAKEKIQELKDQLELSKTLASHKKASKNDNSKLTLNEYIDYLLENGMSAEDIEDTQDEKTKRVEIEGHTFLLEETDTDIEISYEGQTESADATFSIELLNIEKHSIKVKVNPKRTGEISEYKYYIKNLENGEEYQLKDTLKEDEYTYENLTYNTKYKIKVEAIISSGNLIREKEATTAPAEPFYFNAIVSEDTVIFERTANESDHEEILTTVAPVELTIQNNNGTDYNTFDANYDITIIDSNKFTFVEGDKITKTIKGNSKINDTFTLNLKIKDLSIPDKTVKIRVASTMPGIKTIDIDLNVEQYGAIQTIEDLLDLSIAVRGKNRQKDSAERYKLTRDLDFRDVKSYEDAYRTDYGNVNMDGIISESLMAELSTNAGFLPIGINEDNHDFTGTFNGGNHTISNLRIWKSLQETIGLFGYTNGADIRNLIIKNGEVHNNNQTAGMLIGKAVGGIIENITIDGGTVMSLDQNNTERDTYAGGIVGFIETGATIKNCINKANVTTSFNGDTNNYSGPAGGIAAWVATSNIENCTNYGTIIGDKYVGGIAGFGAMQDSINTDGSGTISDCGNYGYIKSNTLYSNGGSKHIGGIVGYLKAKGTVKNCNNYAESKVEGSRNVGGIVGNNNGKVDSCNNYSTQIIGDKDVGNICGLNKGTATNCN